MELKNLSASTIDAFMVCPRRQYMKMTSKDFEQEPSQFLTVGSAAHEALRRYHTDVLDETPLIDYFKEEVQKLGFIPFNAFSSACEFLVAYESNYARKQNVVFLEKDFLVNMGGYPVRGFIDRVDYLGDGEYEIIDYKTSWVTKTPWELIDDVQLITYDVALRILADSGDVLLPAPIKKVKVSLHYLRYDKVSAEYTDEQRVDYLDYVKLIGDQITALEGPPKARLNTYCRYCDHQKSCEVYNSNFADALRKELAKDPEELAEDLETLRKISRTVSARINDIEDVLMSAMEPSGLSHIEAGEYNIDIKAKTYTTYDAKLLSKLIPDTFMKYVYVKNKEAKNATPRDKVALDKIARTHNSAAYISVSRIKGSGKKNDPKI